MLDGAVVEVVVAVVVIDKEVLKASANIREKYLIIIAPRQTNAMYC